MAEETKHFVSSVVADAEREAAELEASEIEFAVNREYEQLRLRFEDCPDTEPSFRRHMPSALIVKTKSFFLRSQQDSLLS